MKEKKTTQLQTISAKLSVFVKFLLKNKKKLAYAWTAIYSDIILYTRSNKKILTDNNKRFTLNLSHC